MRASGGKLTIGCYEVDAATARRVLARIDAGPVTVRGEWVTFDDERGRVKFAATGHVLSYDDVRRACSLLLGTEGTDGTEGATDSTEGA